MGRRRAAYQGRRGRQKLQRTEHGEKSKVPKKKYALIFGYRGTNYHGLQKQVEDEENIKTVEGVLQEALRSINAISEAQLADPVKLHWARVGRTDRGVHAACQVICAKLSMGPFTEEDMAYIESCRREKSEQHRATAEATAIEDNDDEKSEETHPGKLQRIRELRFLQNLQSLLPEDIQLFDVVRVWGTWDARMRAGRRIYEYCIPTRALQRCRLQDNEANFMEFCQLRNLSQEEASKKFCSMAKKEKLMAALRLKDESILSQLREDKAPMGLATIAEQWRLEMSTIRRLFWTADAEQRQEMWTAFGCTLPEGVDKPPYPPATLSAFTNFPFISTDLEPHFSDDDLKEFQSLLDLLEGSHHWYNYTSRLSATDPSGQRYVEGIKAYRMERGGESKKYVIVRIIGQSFLLNQIRKMLAVAIETFIGVAPACAIMDLFTAPLEPKKHVHLAPGEGLLLERAFFDLYDNQNHWVSDQLILHHPFELKYPHGKIMDKFLTTGEYPDLKDDNLTVHGVTKKLNQSVDRANLLLDSELSVKDNQRAPMQNISSWEHDNIPTWAKILKFKHDDLHRWIMRLFDSTDVWRRYMSDVLWHPFVIENYPTPLERCIEAQGPTSSS
eukprot:Gregarina_sp_Poly_1__1336@NODE_132_length_13232_cov_209_776377_g118_i0_p1_GENE_NODE_132_length_13232_cov_209_776377_g118_i0NODE_132_length_13232_cov_209_776377_g118_i0_p1_ORF_typecomplete_len615_score85_00PseudoU_synth_1/PF01416_20/0_068PseudoU_synth_1/PF01416_20/2e12HTH_IclR/PF09339_10/0_0081Sigma54_DBD/PF04552_13/1_4e02Sigma54_DBD/PF04552_13/0_6_NODE_132_length_13232_cov_209_776377_g118_i069008744